MKFKDYWEKKNLEMLSSNEGDCVVICEEITENQTRHLYIKKEDFEKFIYENFNDKKLIILKEKIGHEAISIYPASKK